MQQSDGLMIRYFLMLAMYVVISVAVAEITIVRPNMTLVNEDGSSIDGMTDSTTEVKAMEKASRLPDGIYHLIRPTATISVSGNKIEPTPEPQPEPTPEPIPEPTPEPIPTPTPIPDPNLRDPANDAEIIGAITGAVTQHPTQAVFTKISGSEIDVLVKDGEFEFCKYIACYKSQNAFIDWTGGAWNWKDWEFAQPAGGGHADYGGNEVYVAELKLDSANNLAVDWSRPIDPQPLSGVDCGAPISGPVASHTYATPLYIEKNDEYWHHTTGGWPATTACAGRGVETIPGKGGWVHDKATWRKTDSERMEYGRACYHRNRNMIYVRQQANGSDYYTIDASNDYAMTVKDNVSWLSGDGYFDSAMDQQRDICYWYEKQRGIRGVHYDPVTGGGSSVFTSNDLTMNVPSLSVEHSTGDLVVVGSRGSVKHISTSTGIATDVSAVTGMPLPHPTAENIFGKFDMIEKIPCVGIGMVDPRDGVYLMTLPANVCSMDSAPVAPPVVEEPPIAPIPVVEPEPEPRHPNAVVMTIQEAVAQKLVPEYENLGYSVSVRTPVNMTGAGGERPEIGLLMEPQAALIATGDAKLQADVIAIAQGDEPWDDYSLITKAPYSLEFAHTPNLFYLPYLLTGDPEMLRRMELIYSHYKKWRSQPLDSRVNAMTGREFAWQIRNLAHLAMFQKQGLTENTYYITALDKTRDYLLNTIANPNHETEEFRVISWNTVYSGSYGFTGWMQSFIGQTINHMIQIGFTDWLPIAEWHLEHLKRRCGERWPLKGCDNDHVFFANYMTGDKNWTTVRAFAGTTTWETITPYPAYKVNKPEYINQPDDELLPHGTGFTYANRAQYAYGWAALAAKNGIAGAQALADKLKAAITKRGDRWDYKNAVSNQAI
jgi:hypothetical protein